MRPPAKTTDQPAQDAERTPAWVWIVLAASVLLAMGQVVTHEFVIWDDDHTITGNPAFNPPTVGGILTHWTSPRAGLYVPVTYTVWGLLALLGGERGAQPWLYHAASLLLHFAAAGVVFKVLQLLFRRNLAACLGAVLFAVHPVQVEPVAWASGLKDVLFALLSLVAIWQYLLAIRPDSNGVEASPYRSAHYWIGLAALALALLSKPTAVVTPFLALVLDWLLVRHSLRLALRSLWPWFALIVPCALWTKLVQESVWSTPVPLWQRPLIAADALAFYLYKLVLPLELTFDYGRYPAYAMERGWPYWTWIVPAALAVAVVLSWRRARPLAAAALVFLAGVLPVLGFTRFMFQSFSTVADHYLYVSMLGPAILLAWLLARSPDLRLGAVAILLLVVLAVRSTAQTSHWQNDKTLFEHAVSVNPRSWQSHNNLGYVRFRERRLDDAAWHCRQAIELQPEYFKAYENLARVRIAQGRPLEALAAMEEMHRRIEQLPPQRQAAARPQWKQLGMIYLAAGRPQDAVHALRKHLERVPHDAEARAQLNATVELLESPATRPSATR